MSPPEPKPDAPPAHAAPAEETSAPTPTPEPAQKMVATDEKIPDQARAFLATDEVKNASQKEKVSFLKSKGLSEEHIAELLAEQAQVPPATEKEVSSW